MERKPRLGRIAVPAVVGVIFLGLLGVQLVGDWLELGVDAGYEGDLADLVGKRPLLAFTVSGTVDDAEAAVLDEALTADTVPLADWFDLLVRTSGALAVDRDGQVRLEVAANAQQALELAFDPSSLPAHGAAPTTVEVSLDVGARGLSAVASAVAGEPVDPGAVVQALIATNAGPLLDERVTGGRARTRVEVEIAGAAGLDLLAGGGGPFVAGEGAVELPRRTLQAGTDLLLGLPVPQLLDGPLQPLDLGPAEAPADGTVRVDGLVEIVGPDRPLRLGSVLEVDLVALLAAGLRDRGEDAAADLVEGWEVTVLRLSLREFGIGPDELLPPTDAPRVAIGELLSQPQPPTDTTPPDDSARRELARDVEWMAEAAEELRGTTGAYPTTITEIIRATELAVDPIYPSSTLGWLYRVGDVSDDTLCIEARHDGGEVWSARSSADWMVASEPC